MFDSLASMTAWLCKEASLIDKLMDELNREA